MKRWFGFGIVTALLIAALAVAQWRKPHAEVAPDAVLHFIGDTEKELSRLPMSATRLSDSDEIRVGNELAARYKYMEELAEDNEENRLFRRYIERVGARVAVQAERKLPYTFHYIPQQYMVNAFAIPGGHVYVGKGLLDLMDSEDELASVLGHEIEHIDRRHAVERLQTEATLRRLGLFRLLAQIPIEVFQAGYNKEQELEADREGTRLAVNAGYSPVAAIRMFESFDRRFRKVREQQANSPQEEAARLVLATMGEYFRSHPSSKERISRIQALITQERWTARAEKPFELAYLLWTDRAETALQRHKYEQAASFASQAGNYPRALELLARAEYFQADFDSSAGAYRKLIGTNKGGEYIQPLSEMLVFADPQTASQEFLNALGADRRASTVAEDELAGLTLLSGDPHPVAALVRDIKSKPIVPSTPDRLARFGWWYYLAGDYMRARELGELPAQQRPADFRINIDYGWTLIEAQRFADAINTFTGLSRRLEYVGQPFQLSQATMGLAVSNWLAQNHDEALVKYRAAIVHEPAWSNPHWIRPQYPPTVLIAISEMKAEIDRRNKLRLAKATEAGK